MKNKKSIAMAMAAVSTLGAVAPAFAHTADEVENGAHNINLHIANNRTFVAYYADDYDNSSEKFKSENNVVAVTKKGDREVYILSRSANNETAAKAELARLEELQTEIKSDLEKTYKAGTKELPLYTITQGEVKRQAEVGGNEVTVVDYKVTLKANINEYKGEKIEDKTFIFTGLRFANTGLGFDQELDVKEVNLKFTGRLSDSQLSKYRELNQIIFELNEAKANNQIIIVKSNGEDSVKLDISLMDGTKIAMVNIDGISKIVKDQVKVIPTTNDFNNHWAKDTIVKNMLDGVVDVADEFRPEESITRAEFAKIMVERFDIPYDNHMIENFTDVKGNDWYYEYVTALANCKNENGVAVLEGNGDGTFRPDAPITRQEAAKMIATLLGQGETYTEDLKGNRVHTTVDTTHIFADGKDIAEWADESVKNLNGLKVGDTSIITGYEENGKTYFKPANNIKRAEALVMMDRAFQAK